MAKFRHNQTNFTAGEFSPKLSGRTDLTKYRNSAETLENFIVNPHGGVRKRPGFKYLGAVKDADNPPRLIPFQFNDEDVYMLEAGGEYMRFWRNGELILNNASQGTYWSTGDLVDNIDPAYSTVALESTSDDVELTVWPCRVFYPSGGVTDESSGTGTLTVPFDGQYRLDSDSAGNEAGVAVELNVKNNATDGEFLIYFVNGHASTSTGTFKFGTSAGDDSLGSGTWSSSGKDRVVLDTDFTPSAHNFWVSIYADANDTAQVNSLTITGYSPSGNTGETLSITEESTATANLVSDSYGTGISLIGTSGGDKAAVRPTFTESDFKDATDQYTLSTRVYVGLGTLQYKVTDGSSFSDTEIASGSIQAGIFKTITYTPPVNDVYYIHFYNDTTTETRFKLVDMFIATDPYEINTPWQADEIGEVKFTQSNDVMFLTHPWHAPQQLTRTDHASWTLADYDTLDGPYLDRQIFDPVVGLLDANATVSAGPEIVFSSSTYTSAQNIGRLFRWRATSSDSWGYGQLTGINGSNYTFDWILNPGGATTGASDQWHLSAWGNSGNVGWPSVCEFYEQRLYFGGSPGKPLTLWGSRAGSFDDFSPDNDTNKGEQDDDTAVTFTISSSKGGAIHWMSSRKSMFVGTSVAIFNLRASTQGEAITPSNINVIKESGTSVKNTQKIDTDTSVLFVNRYGRTLHELAYNFEADAFQAPDLSILSEHLTHPGIDKVTRQEQPDNVIWLLTTDGNLRSLTFLREQEVVAWSKHTIGGTPTILDIETLPGDNEHELWAVTQRTIDSTKSVYIERMSERFDQDALADAFFVDCGLTYSGTSTSSVTGMDHLEGESIVALNNGTVETGLSVSSGSVAMGTATTKSHLGYSYDAIIQTHPIESQQSQTIQGRLARVPHIILRVIETLGGKLGFSSSDTLDTISYSDDDAPADSNSVRNGDVRIQVPKGYERNTQLYLKFDEPTPVTVNSIIAEVNTGGE